MYRSELARIGTSLQDKDSLIQFLGHELGYRINPVSYEAADLGIPPYLARDVKAWWLVSYYPDRLPFQVHLVQIKELTFNCCRNIIDAFSRQHPGYFLFIFTKDYSYLLFIAIEWSLERRPKLRFRFGPKPYYRFLLMDRCNPTENDARVLSQLRFQPSAGDPQDIYRMVLEALKLSEHWGGLPEWFMPWYYRLGFSPRIWGKLKKSGKI